MLIKDPLLYGPAPKSALGPTTENSNVSKTPQELNIQFVNPLRDFIWLLVPRRFFLELSQRKMDTFLWVKALFFAAMAVAGQQHLANINGLGSLHQGLEKLLLHPSMAWIFPGLDAYSAAHIQKTIESVWILFAQVNVIWAPVRELSLIFFELLGIVVVLHLFGRALAVQQIYRTLLGLFYLRWYGFLALMPGMGPTAYFLYSMFATLFMVRWMWDCSRPLSILCVSLWGFLGMWIVGLSMLASVIGVGLIF